MREVFNHVDFQDVVTFTGSFETGLKLKQTPAVLENSVPFNMEADSLNCCVLGYDATPGTEEFDLFIKDVAKEMTIKTGQKCTAIRRAIVPEKMMEDVKNALVKRLKGVTIGDPQVEGVRMGALAGMEQLRDVKSKVEILKNCCELVMGGEDFDVIELTGKKALFMMPHLFTCSKGLSATTPHEVEAFGLCQYID